MWETLLATLGGGVVRILPELLKFFDRKNERQHELAMTNLQMEAVKVQGDYKLEERRLDLDGEWVKAIAQVNESQAKMAKAAGKFVAGVSALVRPTITYWLVLLYTFCKVSSLIYAYSNGMPFVVVVEQAWTPADDAILGSILGFWFVGRVWDRKP